MILTDSRTPCACVPGDVSLYTTYMPFYLILSGHGESNIPFFTASMNSCSALFTLPFGTFLSLTFFYGREQLSHFF